MHKKTVKEFKKYKEEDFLFELSNYDAEVTGLPMLVWVGTGANTKHGPRVKVQRSYKKKMNSSDMFVVSVSDAPEIKEGDQGDITNKDLKKLFTWIALNKLALLKLWNEEYSTFREFEKDLKKL